MLSDEEINSFLRHLYSYFYAHFMIELSHFVVYDVTEQEGAAALSMPKRAL